MFSVNLYIQTTIKGPYKSSGKYVYLLEFIREDNTPFTRYGMGCVENATRQQLELTAVIMALRRIKKESEIRIFTECGGLLAPVENGWIKNWKINDWKTAKGEPVKQAKLWKELDRMSEMHLLLEEKGAHSYRLWMEEELKKEIVNEEDTVKTKNAT